MIDLSWINGVAIVLGVVALFGLGLPLLEILFEGRNDQRESRRRNQ
jgi:hypothetical protein